MTPGKRDPGARPEIEMGILESDVHHIREQNDRDRRAFAERMIELREWRERIESKAGATALQLARLADTCDRLEVARKADAAQLADVVATVHRARGALWVLGVLASFAGVGTILQIVRLLLETHR